MNLWEATRLGDFTIVIGDLGMPCGYAQRIWKTLNRGLFLTCSGQNHS